MSYYENAQICRNGHVITNNLKSSPNLFKEFCTKCGSPTITHCPKCDTPIQGDYVTPGVVVLRTSQRAAPSFCHNCGEAYPWTETALNAAYEIIEFDDQLSIEDKTTLKSTLPDLITEGPRTKVASHKFKIIITKALQSTGQAVRDIIVDIASESVKKILYPDS